MIEEGTLECLALSNQAHEDYIALVMSMLRRQMREVRLELFLLSFWFAYKKTKLD